MTNTKLDRINQKIESAECLIKQEFYLDAVSLYWQASRDSVFFWLMKQGINFSSTNDALRHAILNVDDELREKIIQSEIIGTLAEWDEFFSISKEQVFDFKNTCILIINSLGYGND